MHVFKLWTSGLIQMDNICRYTGSALKYNLDTLYFMLHTSNVTEHTHLPCVTADLSSLTNLSTCCYIALY